VLNVCNLGWKFRVVLQVKKILCDWLARLLFMKRPSSARSMLCRSRPRSDVNGVFTKKSTAGVDCQGDGCLRTTDGEVGIALKTLCGPRDTVVFNTVNTDKSSGRTSLAVDLATPNSHFKTQRPAYRDHHQHRGTRGLSPSGETWSLASQLLSTPAMSCRVTAYDPHGRDPSGSHSSPSKVEGDVSRDAGGLASSAAVDALGAVLYELQLLTGKLGDEEMRLAICSDWKFAAMVVDRFCLILFSVFTVVSTFAILFSAPHVMAS